MSFKTKALGLAAATALSLSIVSGAMAAGPNDSASTTVQLNDNGQVCQATGNDAELNLGSWTWNNGAYTLDSGSSASAELTVDVSNGAKVKPANCYVTVTFNDLTGSGGTIVAADHITLASSGSNTNKSTSALSSGSYANVTEEATLDLNNVTFDPATYTGTVTITASNTSN